MAVMVLFTGCGKKKTSKLEKCDISSGTVVMMVGDYQVRYSEVMAYCYFLKCQYEDSFWPPSRESRLITMTGL